jgi:hypothetical protein
MDSCVIMVVGNRSSSWTASRSGNFGRLVVWIFFFFLNILGQLELKDQATSHTQRGKLVVNPLHQSTNDQSNEPLIQDPLKLLDMLEKQTTEHHRDQPFFRRLCVAMSLSTDVAVRSALSQICNRCSPSTARQARSSSRFLQASAKLRAPSGTRTLHSGSARPLSNAPLRYTRRYAEARFSSGLASQPSFTSGSRGVLGTGKLEEAPKRVLAADDLFHSFTNSPIPEIRLRAAYIRQHAYCSHHDHHSTRVPESASGKTAAEEGGNMAPVHVDFECPDCGIPLYCSKEHWADDYENHLEICDTLRQINEDDHDLRSGRFFPEFDYAGPQIEEAMINMTNWDTFLYTRNFQAINDDRSMRQATRLLTYPVTIGSILHELSPYSIRNGERMTVEGLKSFSGMSSSWTSFSLVPHANCLTQRFVIPSILP